MRLISADGEQLGIKHIREAMDEAWDAAAIHRWGMEFAWPAVAGRVRRVYAELCP